MSGWDFCLTASMFSCFIDYELARCLRRPAVSCFGVLNLRGPWVSDHRSAYRLLSLLRQNLRLTDQIGQYQDGFGILLPESTRSGCEVVSQRIDGLARGLGLELEISLECYPHDDSIAGAVSQPERIAGPNSPISSAGTDGERHPETSSMGNSDSPDSDSPAQHDWQGVDRRHAAVQAPRYINHSEMPPKSDVTPVVSPAWSGRRRVHVGRATGSNSESSTSVMVCSPFREATRFDGLDCATVTAREAQSDRNLSLGDRCVNGCASEAWDPSGVSTSEEVSTFLSTDSSAVARRKNHRVARRVRTNTGNSVPNGSVRLVRRTPIWKRTVDICGSGLGLLVLSPVLVGLAVAIRLESKGPALFLQQREGKDGRIFRMVKLRTMHENAEQLQASLRCHNQQDGPAFKMESDPRVTRLGRILRKSCIDELPQLWNVLRGDMSLVGPRPLPVSESLECELWQRRRLTVLPGLTCEWQASGEQRTDFSEWMRMDLRYVDRQGPWVDFKLLLKTFGLVSRGRGSV
jgi:lipopolysaccharide/colanic/teichoic acid biosynthesis glycosyltransferase